MIEIKNSENKNLDIYINELEEKKELYIREQINSLLHDMENILNVIKALRKNNK
jgi:hypothetical protein